MKATIEMNGYIITVNQSEDGTLSVQATKDDDVVEEFTINTEEDVESQGQSEPDGDDDDDDVMPFGGEEEDDLGDNDSDDSDDMDETDDMDDESPVDQSDDSGEPKLESFSSFVRKRK